MPSRFSRLRSTQSYNVRTLRSQPLAEISGSLGDLGTLLPILVALTVRGSISLPSTLLFTGVANILTGVAFGVPLPVQPMKAIAAVALAKHFSMSEMAAAGISMGVAVGLLSVTGGIGWVERQMPLTVVRGIMIGAGLSLCISAGKDSLMGSLGWTGPWWGDNYIVAIVAALLLLLQSVSFPRAPYALLVFVVGIVFSVIRINTFKHHDDFPDGVMWIPILLPSGKTFLDAIFSASLGQLPLTLLNSIIAVTALSRSLLPSRPEPSTTALGASVSLINLVAPWFGGMPACHGSGGLAGQYRFGARSGGSIILLGLVKVAFGLVALFNGRAVATVLYWFPRSLLGILVIAAGIELARGGIGLSDKESGHRGGEESSAPASVASVTGTSDEAGSKDGWMVVLVTVAGLLTFKNDAVGFVAGMSWHYGIKLSRRRGHVNWPGRFSWRRSRDAVLGERRPLLD